MKKLLLISLFAFYTFISINAQEATQTQSGYVVLHTSTNFFTNLPKQKEAPKGSVYLFDDFLKSTVILRDSSIVSEFRINLNLYSKQIEFLNEDQVAILNYSKIDKFYVNDNGRKEFFTSCPNLLIQYPDLGDCSFVNILYEGKKATLIDKVTLDMVPSNYNLALNAGNSYDTYYVKHNYYILKDGKALIIRLSKSSILFVLNDKRKELSNFIADNDLNLKNKGHVIEVLKYYNNLYEQNTH